MLGGKKENIVGVFLMKRRGEMGFYEMIGETEEGSKKPNPGASQFNLEGQGGNTQVCGTRC
jgi:hypothetical protein